MLLSARETMMAGFIEESTEEFIQDEEQVQDISSQQEEEEIIQEPEQEEEALPDKYKGKSAKEIAQMHMEAERLIGRQGSEVGELRRLVDDYIRAQAATKQQLQAEPIDEDEYFVSPAKAVEKAIDNHPKIKQAEMLAQEMVKSKALSALQAEHPDYLDVITDPGFQAWKDSSKIRQELFSRADRNYDYDAANELLSLYKERKSVAAETVKAEKEVRKQVVKSATTTVASGSDEAPSKKVFRRADIIRLMQTDPDKYDMMQSEIMAAYREGRVR
jgi:hypothetical protein